MEMNGEIAERIRRRERVKRTVAIIKETLGVTEWNRNEFFLIYDGYWLQITFSEAHPFMLVCYSKPLDDLDVFMAKDLVNELNLGSVLGCHVVTSNPGSYSYRATQWLNEVFTAEQFLEILTRCLTEAKMGYSQILQASVTK